jgi:hypothetical protein
VRCAGLTSALVLLATFVLAPLAYRQLGAVGLSVLGSAAGTIMLATVLSHAMARYFASSGRTTAGLLIAMIARMFVPLSFVLAIVVWDSPGVPTWTAMYIAPLYFVMLITETAFAIRRCNSGKSSMGNRNGQLSQLASNER